MQPSIRLRGVAPRPNASTGMIELLRTNDLVLISIVESLLDSNNVGFFVADGYTSAIEGSLGFLPRRVLVPRDEAVRARRVLTDAGFAHELREE